LESLSALSGNSKELTLKPKLLTMGIWKWPILSLEEKAPEIDIGDNDIWIRGFRCHFDA
jgi:hypothetical protein